MLIEDASYKDRMTFVSGNPVPLKRGQLLASERALMEKWGWARQRVRTYLKHLEADGKITRVITQGMTLLTVCNYRKFQDRKNSDNPAGNQQVTHEQPTSNQAVTHEQPIIEEGKESKEGKERDDDARKNFDQKVVDAAGLFVGSCMQDLHLVTGWLEKGLDEGFILGEIGRVRSNKLAKSEEAPSSLRYYDSCFKSPPRQHKPSMQERIDAL